MLLTRLHFNVNIFLTIMKFVWPACYRQDNVDSYTLFLLTTNSFIMCSSGDRKNRKKQYAIRAHCRLTIGLEKYIHIYILCVHGNREYLIILLIMNI